MNRVLPYSNQQFSTTFGGPIRKDKIHFFASYEYEREPSTQTYTTAHKSFNQDLTGTRTDPKAGGRVDLQFSPQVRLMVRGNVSRLFTPFDPRYTGGSSPVAIVFRVDSAAEQRSSTVRSTQVPRHQGRQRDQGGLRRFLLPGASHRALCESPRQRVVPLVGRRKGRTTNDVQRLRDRAGAHKCAAAQRPGPVLVPG